jgi:hypothetical protein
MMKKIPYLMMSSVMIASLLSGCGIEKSSSGTKVEVAEPRTEEAIHASEAILGDAHVSEENGKVKINYTAKNISKSALQILFQSGMKVDYILYDQDGKEIEQYSKKSLSTMAQEEVTLASDEVFSEEFVFDSLVNGNYSIEVFLNEPEQNGKAVLNFDVKTSLYHNGVGTLTGRVDLNSVEIAMEGSPRVFQLTDFAKEQLLPIEDGTDLKFIYTETGIEQPTIEKFILEPSKISLKGSVLELDSELVGVQDHIRQTRNLEAMAGFQPFEVFRLYMYTKAGEDYETLYYFHNIDEDNLPVAKYVEENRTEDATVQNRDFMKKLNEVRDFEIILTEANRATIAFKLPGTNDLLEFKLMKGDDNTWRALWLPLQ